MKRKIGLDASATVSTVASYIVSGIFLILCLLTFALNITSCWELWQLAGFACIGCCIASAATHIPALILSVTSRKRSLIVLNFVSLAVCIAAAVFSYFVSAEYGIFN